MSRKLLVSLSLLSVLPLLNACSNVSNLSSSSYPVSSEVGVERTEMFQHVIASGETLGMIASWYTGKTNNWEEIQFSNPNIDPTKMVVGEVIFIPMYLMIRQDALPESLIRTQKATTQQEVGDDKKSLEADLKTERERLLEELLQK